MKKNIKISTKDEQEKKNLERIKNMDSHDVEEAIVVVDTVESLAAKVQSSIDTFPSWVYGIPVSVGVRPSNKTSDAAFILLCKLYDHKLKDLPPSYTLETKLARSNAVITPTSVEFIDPKTQETETYAVINSMLVKDEDDAFTLLAGVTATLIASTTRIVSDGAEVVDWKTASTEVPSVDLLNARVNILKVMEANASVARNQLYSALRANFLVCCRLHSSCGDELSNYVHHKSLSEFYANEMRIEDNARHAKSKIKKAIKYRDPVPLKCVCVGDKRVLYTADVKDAWRFHALSIGIRGEKKKLSSGYQRFENTPALASTLEIVQDVMNCADHFRLQTIVLGSVNDLSKECIRVLIYNGYSIVITGAGYPKFNEDKPGLYGFKPQKSKYMMYKTFSADMMGVTVSKTSVAFKDIENILNVMKASHQCITVYPVLLNSALETDRIRLYPSTRADQMVVLAVCGPSREAGYSLKNLTMRATMADCVANNFVFERRAFHTVETMTEFVKWDRPIRYPIMRTLEEIKANKMSEYDANLVRSDPIVINAKEFENISKQMKAVLPRWQQALIAHIDEVDFFSILASKLIGDKKGLITDLPKEHYVNEFNETDLEEVRDYIQERYPKKLDNLDIVTTEFENLESDEDETSEDDDDKKKIENKVIVPIPPTIEDLNVEGRMKGKSLLKS